MNVAVWSRSIACAVLLVAVGACSSGPPAISEVKIGKDKEVTNAANSFDTRDTLFAVANIDNPPAKGKVVGRLAIIDVEGQEPGPIPGLETTLDLAGGMNKVNFNFSAPTAGWPDGKYRIEVVLLDESGAEKDQKVAELTMAGNQLAAPEGDTEAPAEEEAPSQ